MSRTFSHSYLISHNCSWLTIVHYVEKRKCKILWFSRFSMADKDSKCTGVIHLLDVPTSANCLNSSSKSSPSTRLRRKLPYFNTPAPSSSSCKDSHPIKYNSCSHSSMATVNFHSPLCTFSLTNCNKHWYLLIHQYNYWNNIFSEQVWYFPVFSLTMTDAITDKSTWFINPQKS